MSQEVLSALEAMTTEMRHGFEKIHGRIEAVERVVGITHDEISHVRAHVLEQVNTTGQRVKQLENVVSSISQQMAIEATQEAHA
jgi:uncharacterized protein Yka (UPF0111/DUF47 family)